MRTINAKLRSLQNEVEPPAAQLVIGSRRSRRGNPSSRPAVRKNALSLGFLPLPWLSTFPLPLFAV
jgi:hypothetical protein